MVVVACALGRRLLRLFKLSFPALLEDLVFSTAMGLGLLGLVTFLLGAFSLLYPATACIVVVLAGIFCFRDVAGVARDIIKCPAGEFRRTRGFTGKALLSILAALFIINIIGAMAPPSQVDPLIYHLAGPKRYLAAHHLHYIPYNLFFSYPCHLQMVFLFSMMLGGETCAQLVHCAFGILMVMQVYSMAGGSSGRRSFVAAFTLIAVGGFLGESIFAMVDLGLGCFSLLAFVSFYRWVRDGRSGWILACALFCGFAIGAKTHGAIVPFAIAFLIVIASIIRGARISRAVALALFLIAVSIAVGSPSYIKNYVFTGNPFYPFFYSCFGGRDLTPALLEHLASIGVLGREGVAGKIKLFLVIPWQLTLGTWFYSVYDSYLIGPIYLCLLPLLLHPSFRPSRLDRYILLFSLLYLAGWFLLSPMVRTAYVVWALLAVTVSRIWYGLPRGFARAAATIALVLWVVFQLGVNLYVQLPAYGAALGLKTKRDYLNEVLPFQSQGYFRWYDDYVWMNDNLPEGSYVLCTSNMNYYLDHPSLSLEYYLWHTYGGEDTIFRKGYGGDDWPALAVSPEKMLGRFSSMGITHMFILSGLDPELGRDSLDDALAYLEDMGLLKKIYDRGRASVYEIARDGLFSPPDEERQGIEKMSNVQYSMFNAQSYCS